MLFLGLRTVPLACPQIKWPLRDEVLRVGMLQSSERSALELFCFFDSLGFHGFMVQGLRRWAVASQHEDKSCGGLAQPA